MHRHRRRHRRYYFQPGYYYYYDCYCDCQYHSPSYTSPSDSKRDRRDAPLRLFRSAAVSNP